MKGANNAPEKQTAPAWEFYDLKNDPQQTRNAYDDPKYAATIKEMKSALLEKRKELGDDDSGFPEMQEIISKYWE